MLKQACQDVGRAEQPQAPRQAYAPTSSKADRSSLSPSRGLTSWFQSPVCTMVPCSLRRIMPQQSGMECVTRTGSHLGCLPVRAGGSSR